MLHAAGMRSLGPGLEPPERFATGVPSRSRAPRPGARPLRARQRARRRLPELRILVDVSHLNAPRVLGRRARSDGGRRSSPPTLAPMRCARRRATSPTTSCARSARAAGSSASTSTSASFARTAPTTRTRRIALIAAHAAHVAEVAGVERGRARVRLRRRDDARRARRRQPGCRGCSTRCATPGSRRTRSRRSRATTGAACWRRRGRREDRPGRAGGRPRRARPGPERHRATSAPRSRWSASGRRRSGSRRELHRARPRRAARAPGPPGRGGAARRAARARP